MLKKSVFLLFPHQLFQSIASLKKADTVYLIEEQLFFHSYKFHKQKLVFHRASMKYYESYLQANQIKVKYIEANDAASDIRNLLISFHAQHIESIIYYDVCYYLLERRIQTTCTKCNIAITTLESLLFINSSKDIALYFGSALKYVQADFYTQQRKKLNILLDENKKPIGGKWSFDEENRLKYPKHKPAPTIQFPNINKFYKEAIAYVEKNFGRNYGTISQTFLYATTHQESQDWLHKFFQQRFSAFGEYEDAIVDGEYVLHHSVLAPMLNVGLLTPMQIIHEAIDYGMAHSIGHNSIEGFVRQIIGWREFIRGVYIYKGTKERNTNFWNFNKKIPPSFYNGTTGIEPVDNTIKKILATGYCHHIERLMVLGNFMLLCEFDPNEVYQWFMELFIDAYDWVMVPNVYGMSQFADGGLMATKPYISGSSYILKMSNYKKGSWCAIWDALFWHFMNKHRDFFLQNPRLGMLIRTFDKMEEVKRQNHIAVAKMFLDKLHATS